MRRALGLTRRDDLAEGLGYSLKRKLLGKPLINEQLGEQRLSKRLALGVLSPDGISSSAYGTEEILIELLKGGLAATAFTVLLPITGVVLFVMILVVLSYREVVIVYTRAGGSYAVARENFGPRVAQIAAVALMVDYVVTVAVQVAAGTAAVASALEAAGLSWLNSTTKLTVMSIIVVLLMLYGNLRGIREAGRSFAVPVYLFSSVMILTIIVGLIREVTVGLPMYHPHAGIVTAASNHDSLITFGLIFVMLRAFANGGSSLTGIEAVSNAVSAFKPPEGRNARRVLVIEGMILGSLVAGISWIAHVTHARPYVTGVPTVISQEARLVFGTGPIGDVMFVLVQAATALILYAGGNTSFNGFPFLASFVAEDAFLPKWLTKRGHRLVFSNGIIVLAVLSIALLAAVGSNVNNLVPFYAIGVFTAFTMAGLGMAKFHYTHKEVGWRHKLVINFSAGVASFIVVVIFAVVKFNEGAWLVLALFAAGVPLLIRLNRQYRMEAMVLEGIGNRARPDPPTYARRTVYVFVDDLDLATIAALRYARSLRPTSLSAVHFVIDNVQADKLRQDWVRANTGIVLDFVDCPDRRLAKAAADLVSADAELPGVGVTAILPRRSYTPVVGRLLHDRTADKMAAAISRIPHAVATIVPFDVRSRVEVLARRHQARTAAAAAGDGAPARGGVPARDSAPVLDSATALDEPSTPADASQPAEAAASTPAEASQPAEAAASTPAEAAADGATSAGGAGAAGTPAARAADGAKAEVSDRDDYERPVPPRGVSPIGSLTKPGRAIAEGRVHSVEIKPVERSTVLACVVRDSTGKMTALFYGRSHIPGLRPGSKVRLRGQVGLRSGKPVMINPAYELLVPGEGDGESPPAH